MVTFYMFLSASVILGFIYITLFLPARFHSEEMNEYDIENKIIKTNAQEQVSRVETKNANTLKAEKVK